MCSINKNVKKIWAAGTHTQVLTVFIAFALMVILSSWFMGAILRKHPVYNAQTVLDSPESKTDLPELRKIKLIFVLLGIILASILSAILINMAASRKKAEARVRIMLDTMHLGAGIHKRNFDVSDYNESVVALFALSDKQEYFDRFHELSPEHQPDRRLSSEKRD